ncbi:flagellar basal body rod protein FlgB [Rhodoferax sp. 4810]|uniref:Flagellar basal body rod protein FlgB n=1 Tax=Thiospirillum jenense TaxID=1653858 RepID=A0A839HI96_9GAMM|nr:flagellar basal body rod protein FlgB [Thiospirillum jenense]MBB1073956.1 flagellar basal body rod protein FlgB [Rhodoferax jenense]MBB1125832.1 flagellar basal body rod protein FlgB [Thiospirillum jenense]
MSLSLDRALSIHPSAVKIRARRLDFLASNLANADTPNYKARDIDFRRELAAAEGEISGIPPLPLIRTQARHLHDAGVGEGYENEKLYRVPAQPSLDGNTVDPQLEHAAFAENAMQMQSSLEFLTRKVAGLRAAMRSE